MPHLFVTNDFPPKIGGIQTMLWELWRRLDPASFVVLTTPHTGAAELGRRAAVPRRPHAPTRCCCPTPWLRDARCGRSPRRSAPTGSCSIRRCPSGCSAPASASRTPWCSTAPRSPCPAACRSSTQLLGHVLRGADLVDQRRRLPAGRGRPAPPAAQLPGVLVPPGVDTDRFRPLDADGAGGRPGAARPARRRAARREREPPRPPQGHGRPHPRRRVCSRRSRPDLCVAIAGGGRDHAAPRAPRAQPRARRCACSGASPHDDLPALYGVRRRVRDAVPQPLGRARAGGLRHRVPRSRRGRGAAGGRGQRGRGRGRRRRRDRLRRRPTRPTRPTVADRLGPAPRRPAAGGPDGRRRAGAGGGRASPTTCSPLVWERRWPRGRLAPVPERTTTRLPATALLNLALRGHGGARGHEPGRRRCCPTRSAWSTRCCRACCSRIGTGALLWAYALGVSREPHGGRHRSAGLFFLGGGVAPADDAPSVPHRPGRGGRRGRRGRVGHHRPHAVACLRGAGARCSGSG